MTRSSVSLPPGTLWPRVITQTQSALENGALQPIATEIHSLEEQGVNFLVRILANLERKAQAKKLQTTTKPKDFNPFLPYDANLFVGDLSATHVCLLNKFNAVDHHLLIITRDFEEQENLLNLEDFTAAVLALTEIDGLVFYNSGKLAGASQRHKHLQLVPLPLVDTNISFPLEPWFLAAMGAGKSLPFQQAIAPCPQNCQSEPEKWAAYLETTYLQLLQQLDLWQPASPKPKPYNLLMTRQWLMLIPRSQESYNGIEVNALGFVGALLVRNTSQLEQLQTIGPFTLLKKVGV
jgi:ATP adenylyltransferase